MLENAIRAISNSNLTTEEKDALLKELANESIKKQQNQNSFEAKKAELVEKERQKAKETRERLEKYQKEAYRKEIIKNSKVKALEYINELAKIKNNHGEYIYKDLEKEYKDGKITEAEIYALYERINNNKMYEDLFKELEEKENKNSQASVANDNSEKNKTHQNKAFHDDVFLEEAADNMTTDEMNTILNMFQSQTKDEKILDEIANRLRVNKDSLEEIAKLKEEKLKKNENNSNDDNSSLNEQNNEEDQENQKSDDDQKSNDDSSSLSDNEEKDNTQDGNDNKMDPTPEPAKKVKFISKAKELLKSKVNANTAKALLVIAGSLAALTLLLVNAPVAVAALGAGYIYNEYQKGAKGR